MRLYGSIEEVATMCRVKIRRLSYSYFMSCFPLIALIAIFCPHHNISTSWSACLISEAAVE